jgi:hypothetical protein
MPLLSSLTSALGVSTLNERTSPIAIQELDENDDYVKNGMLRFQYFPESISDSKSVNWSPKEIPGGSLPLYQWVSSGERALAFQAVFTTDVDFSLEGATTQASVAVTAARSGATTVDHEQSRNVDIRTAVMWLRRFMMPRYAGKVETGGALTRAPRKLQLFMPGTGIGWAGGAGNTIHSQQHYITAIMTACEVTWVQYFPSGFPRIATVQLGFAQVAQFRHVVEFPAPDDLFDRKIMEGSPSDLTSFPYKLRAVGNYK